MIGASQDLILAIRRAAHLEIGSRIENQYLAGLSFEDGVHICALLLASGIVQAGEPGTLREEVIDELVKNLRLEIERLQAAQDSKRAADVEGCT